MDLKEKIFSSNLNWKKSQFIFAFFLFVIVGLILPIWQAQAISWNPLEWGIGDVFGGTITALITTILQIPLFFANAFLGLAATLLGWVTSPSFVSVPYTKLDNPIIGVGWPLTRDLANMGFVIALLFIGLGTALRLGEYQAQKTLPLLIMMAILINFSPVLLGIIVDATNIAMNFFLEGLSGGETFYRIFSQQFAIFQNAWGGWAKGLDLTPVAQTAVLTVFGFFAGIMLLLFAGLFIMRYIAIWMLVILSPIAFFAYVLPATRRIWSMWWNAFIQWCFIGVFAAFFLYLSEQLIKAVSPGTGITFTTTPGTLPGTFLDVLLPYIVVITFMGIGFFLATTASAMGSSQAISVVKKGTGWIQTRRPVQLLQGKLASGTARVTGAVARGAQRLEEAAGKVPIVGQAVKPLTWTARIPHALAGPALAEQAAKLRKVSIPKGWDQMSIPEKENYINAQGLAQDRVVLASKMKNEGTFQKTSEGFQQKLFSDASKSAGNARLKGEVGDILDAFPDQITKKLKIDFELATVPPAKRDEMKKELEGKINEIVTEFGINENEAAGVLHARGLKPKDIPEISKGSIKSKVFRLATQDMTQAHLGRLVDSFDKETVDDVLSEKGGLNTIIDNRENLEDFYLKNPRLVNWFFRTPAGQAFNWQGRRFAGEYNNIKTSMEPFMRITTPEHRPILLEYDRLSIKPTRTPIEDQKLQALRKQLAADPNLRKSLGELQNARRNP